MKNLKYFLSLVVIIILVIATNGYGQEDNATTKQQVVGIVQVAENPLLYLVQNDTQAKQGVFIYIPPILLSSKPKSIDAIIADLQAMIAKLEAVKEK